MIKKLNICLISREYPPHTSNGGIGTYTYHLAHGFTRLGYEVTVIAGAVISKNQNYYDQKVKVYRFVDGKVPIRGVSRITNMLTGSFFSHWWHSRSIFSKIKNLSKIKRFDIIEGPLWDGECFAYNKDLNIPLVVRLQTPIFKSRDILGQSSSEILEYIERIPLEKASLIASISQDVSKLIIDKYKIDPKKIIYSPLGIPLPTIKKVFFKKNSYKLLYVSRLEKRKGTQEFIEALPKIFKQNDKIEVDIIGKDYNQAPGGTSYYNFFKQTVPPRYQSQVKFHGFLTDQRRQSFYNNCDVFILPSRYESFGLVYLEAMAFGKPVIGTKIGGIPEIIEDDYSGLLIDVNNPKQIAQSVLRLFSDDNLRKRLGSNAFKIVKSKFTVEQMIQNSLQVYQKAIDQF